MKKGFSLIELSVVLIIIALVSGGILAGKSIRNTAQIQAVISDLGKYKQAAISYKEKYYYWPGDDPEAGNRWSLTGLAPSNPDYGDGIIGFISDQTVCASPICLKSPEIIFATKELVLAQFITANYSSGVAANFLESPIDVVDHTTLKKAVYYFRQGAGKNAVYISDIIIVSGNINGNTIGIDFDGETAPVGIVKPADALAIDIKIDDGSAASGNIRGLNSGFKVAGVTTTLSTCVDPSTLNYDLKPAHDARCISLLQME